MDSLAVDTLSAMPQAESFLSLTGNWLVALKASACLLGALILGLVVRSIAVKWIEHFSAKTKTRVDDIIIRAIRGPSLLWFIILGLNLASRQVHHNPLVQLWVDRLSLVMLIVSLTWVSARVLSEIINEYGTKIGGALPVTSLTRNVARIVIVTIGGLFVLQALGVSITPILTALGVGGLAVALALQDTLGNLFAGMNIMMAKQIRVGDYVKLDSGHEGHVSDITWRTTTIKTLAGNKVLVPNSKLAQAIITNYHLPDPRMSLQLQFGVSYGSDPEKIERILTEEALKCIDAVEGMLEDPPPSVRFIPGFGESSLNFTLSCQIRDFVDQYLIQHELRKRVLKRFRAEGIEIPFPQRTVHVLEGVQTQ
jgi:small-conductance mechanosensitive channel